MLNNRHTHAMKSCVSGKIPAGITDSNVEFFAQDEHVFAIMQGNMVPVAAWPQDLRESVIKDINLNPQALECLVDAGIVREDDMIEQYIKCRYSALDNSPDIIGGKLQESEYVDCNLRGQCKYEGRLCELLKAPNGTLTKREIDVLRLIPEGLLDKEIADQLGISSLTVGVYMKKLREKTGLKNKAELVRFAFLKNLI